MLVVKGDRIIALLYPHFLSPRQRNPIIFLVTKKYQ